MCKLPVDQFLVFLKDARVSNLDFILSRFGGQNRDSAKQRFWIRIQIRSTAWVALAPHLISHFCSNNALAFGLARALRESLCRRIALPSDARVVNWLHIELCALDSVVMAVRSKAQGVE